MSNDRSPSLPHPDDPDAPELGGGRRVLHLVERLQSGDKAAQEAAAFHLAELGDARAVNHLALLMLMGQVPATRVVWALGRIDADEAREILLEITLAQYPREVRQMALHFLSRAGQGALIARLRGALLTGEGTHANLAAEALYTLDDEQIVPVLLEAVHSGSLSVETRSWVVQALGKYPRQQTFDTLSDLLMTHSVPLIQMAACGALLRQNWPGAADVLHHQLTAADNNVYLEGALLHALTHIAHRDILLSLLPAATAILEEGTTPLYAVAVDLLGALAVPYALETLTQFALRPTRVATDTLNQIGQILRGSLTDQLRGALQEGLRSPDRDAAYHALTVASATLDPAFLPAYLRIIDDPESTRNQHMTASYAIAALDHPDARAQMHRLFDDARFDDPPGDSPEQWSALAAQAPEGTGMQGAVGWILAQAESVKYDPHFMTLAAQAMAAVRGDERVLPFLLEAAAYPVARVRAAAYTSLGLLGDPAAVPILTAGLRDTHLDHVDNACSAARALGRIGGRGAQATLMRALGAWHTEIRLAALEGLARQPVTAAIRKALEHLLTWEPHHKARQAAQTLLHEPTSPE